MKICIQMDDGDAYDGPSDFTFFQSFDCDDDDNAYMFGDLIKKICGVMRVSAGDVASELLHWDNEESCSFGESIGSRWGDVEQKLFIRRLRKDISIGANAPSELKMTLDRLDDSIAKGMAR